MVLIIASNALGIGAASFASGASKDIAESPTAKPERPDKYELSVLTQQKKNDKLSFIVLFLTI
jgi:hypothetical protein